MFKFNFFLFFVILTVTSSVLGEKSNKKVNERLNKINSKYWLLTCTLGDCLDAFSPCLNCFGERGCKLCITQNKANCSVCADDIFNKNDLETINGNQYLLCDSGDPIQSKVCHFYCRGQYAQSGKCIRENNLPICKCSSESGSFTTDPAVSTQTQPPTYSTTTLQSTFSPNKPQIHFNGTVKLNIPIGGYERILPLPNGDLVRGGRGNLIEIWDLQKGIIKRNLTSVYFHPYVFGLLSNGDLVAGYYNNATLLVWDLKVTNGEPLKRIMQTNDTFYCMTVLKNDDLAIGYGNGYDIIIRDSQNGLIKKKLVGHKGPVYQIIELPNGNLASCSSDYTVKVWNISNGAVIKSITHETGVNSITFLPNGYLVSGLSSDGRIDIWNLETNQLIRNLIGHSGYICENNCLHVLANGDLLSGSWDKTIKVWNPYDGTVKLTSPLHKSSVAQLAVLPIGNFISSSWSELNVWN